MSEIQKIQWFCYRTACSCTMNNVFISQSWSICCFGLCHINYSLIIFSILININYLFFSFRDSDELKRHCIDLHLVFQLYGTFRVWISSSTWTGHSVDTDVDKQMRAITSEVRFCIWAFCSINFFHLTHQYSQFATTTPESNPLLNL